MELPVRFVSTIVRAQIANREADPYSPLAIVISGCAGEDFDAMGLLILRQGMFITDRGGFGNERSEACLEGFSARALESVFVLSDSKGAPATAFGWGIGTAITAL